MNGSRLVESLHSGFNRSMSTASPYAGLRMACISSTYPAFPVRTPLGVPAPSRFAFPQDEVCHWPMDIEVVLRPPNLLSSPAATCTILLTSRTDHRSVSEVLFRGASALQDFFSKCKFLSNQPTSCDAALHQLPTYFPLLCRT